jgi:hypothetical protein
MNVGEWSVDQQTADKTYLWNSRLKLKMHTIMIDFLKNYGILGGGRRYTRALNTMSLESLAI